MGLFLILIGLHCLCDYPLQGDFLAKGKNHLDPIPGIPWYHCLFAHAAIHGMAVGIATQTPMLGVCETVLHFMIDHFKCGKMFGYNMDQFLHILCKVFWVYIWWIQNG